MCEGTSPASLPQVRVELYDTRRTKFVTAHNSCLAALALSSNGKLLATASDKGTLVRLLPALGPTAAFPHNGSAACQQASQNQPLWLPNPTAGTHLLHRRWCKVAGAAAGLRSGKNLQPGL